MNKSLSNEQVDTKSVGIIGCGWLGTALTRALIADGFKVTATTQSVDKLSSISALGAQAQLLSLPLQADNIVDDTVFASHSLVICITPRIRQGDTNYPKKIAQLVERAERGQVKQIILISTTAVYDGYSGEVTEDLPLKQDLAKVDILARAEQHVLNFPRASVVLRCAGLVGEDRQPGRFFNQNRRLTSPNAYVNLIHQADVVAQIIIFIKAQHHTGIFNAVAEMNISKQQFYTLAAQALKLPVPSFGEPIETSKGKKIVGDKLVKCLNYRYRYGDLAAWLVKD